MDLNVKYKIFRKKIREKSLGPRARQRVLRLDTESMTHKRKFDKWDFIKMKKVCSAKDPVKRMERYARDWRKYWQTIYPMEDLHLEYSQRSTIF